MAFQGPETSGLEQRRAREQIAREDALRTALAVLRRGCLIEHATKAALDKWHRDRNAAIAKIGGVLADEGGADDAQH